MDAESLLVSPEQMREMDRLTIDEIGIPGIVLMERAAMGACDALMAHFPEADTACVLCGPGNNGGDGLAMARLLSQRGFDVDVVLAVEPDKYTGDALTNLHICARLGFEFFPVAVLDELPRADVYVDALLGTGIDRLVDASSAIGQAISFLHERTDQIFCVDIPSGVHGLSGQPAGMCVAGAATATFGLRKLGLALEPGRSLAGEITLVDIGIPDQVIEDVGWEAVNLRPEFLHVPKRPATFHKGDAGRVVIVGGAPGHSGSVYMAGRAALVRGAGLITVVTHASTMPLIAMGTPELMTADFEDMEALTTAVASADVVVVGPGLGQDERAAAILKEVLSASRQLVIDADALNLVSTHQFDVPPGSVLTPHPGEASRLLDRDVREILLHPVQAAIDLASKYDATVVLKGASSVVVSNDGRIGINATGNAGMATGGMGDALTGIVAATLCDSADPFEALCHAVCLHGHAGDISAAELGQRGLTVTSLLDALQRIWPLLEVA